MTDQQGPGYFPEDIVGRAVHCADTPIHVELPPLERGEGWRWRLTATMLLSSYWLPDVNALLHRFWFSFAIERLAPAKDAMWNETSHTSTRPVWEAAYQLLQSEFGGDAPDYACVHLFSHAVNKFGHVVRRAVQAHETFVKRATKALDQEVLAGAVRVTADDEAPKKVTV